MSICVAVNSLVINRLLHETSLEVTSPVACIDFSTTVSLFTTAFDTSILLASSKS